MIAPINDTKQNVISATKAYTEDSHNIKKRRKKCKHKARKMQSIFVLNWKGKIAHGLKQHRAIDIKLGVRFSNGSSPNKNQRVTNKWAKYIGKWVNTKNVNEPSRVGSQAEILSSGLG